MTINNEDYTFYYHRARLIGNTIAADYVTYDPQNYPIYQVTVVMVYDNEEGNHDCSSQGIINGPFEVFLFYKRNPKTNTFKSTATFPYRSGSTLSLLERDSSWSTYQIAFNVRVNHTADQKHFTISCSDASFTIDEVIEGDSITNHISYKYDYDGIVIPRIEPSTESTPVEEKNDTSSTASGNTGSSYHPELYDPFLNDPLLQRSLFPAVPTRPVLQLYRLRALPDL